MFSNDSTKYMHFISGAAHMTKRIKKFMAVSAFAGTMTFWFFFRDINFVPGLFIVVIIGVVIGLALKFLFSRQKEKPLP